MANKTKAELEAELQLLQQDQQPVRKAGFFDALNSLFSAVFTTATVLDKTVQLAEREVDNLEVYQQIRLERVKHEQDLQRKELANKLAKA